MRAVAAYVVATAAVAAGYIALDDARWTVPALVAVAALSLAWGAVGGLLAPAGPVLALAACVAVAALLYTDATERRIAAWLFAVVFAGAELCAVLGALGRAFVALAPERPPS
jgi:hypothetical protein